jgi:hypothetical protein
VAGTPRVLADVALALLGGSFARGRDVSLYRLDDTTGDDLRLIEHPAPNVEPGDVVVLSYGREALVTARVETKSGQIAALLEVAIAPTPLTSDESIA